MYLAGTYTESYKGEELLQKNLQLFDFGFLCIMRKAYFSFQKIIDDATTSFSFETLELISFLQLLNFLGGFQEGIDNMLTDDFQSLIYSMISSKKMTTRWHNPEKDKRLVEAMQYAINIWEGKCKLKEPLEDRFSYKYEVEKKKIESLRKGSHYELTDYITKLEPIDTKDLVYPKITKTVSTTF